MAELDIHFRCDLCGEQHRPLPLSYSAKLPWTLLRVPPEERQRRVVITPDQCVIDDKLFFLRGRIVVPIHDHHEPFIWGVWSQVSLKDFFRTQQLWRTPGRESEPSFAGRLDTDLAIFGGTLDLQVRIQTQVVGRRPHCELAAGKHPLGREQAGGITLRRAEQIAAWMLHPIAAEQHRDEQKREAMHG